MTEKIFIGTAYTVCCVVIILFGMAMAAPIVNHSTMFGDMNVTVDVILGVVFGLFIVGALTLLTVIFIRDMKDMKKEGERFGPT